ncbi:protein COBRA isoform X2 [Silene latifolia]|uniref:protein COBRA isoform X2 n=1 Tax=Silene latifolia TaxID=37657 RepID=UPI003D76E9C5
MLISSAHRLSIFTTFVLFSLYSLNFTPSAYGRSNPNGNITSKWDVVQWTPDGYVAVVTIYNFQHNRRIQAPGWRLGWTWAKKEVIWNVVGAKATRQGDCSRFKRNIPHSCSKNPTIIDLKPDAPYNQRIANCCRGGVLSSWFGYRPHSVSAFQISVGNAGTTNRTVRMPKKFTFDAPGAVYTCGPSKIIRPTIFITADRRRMTQALMTWNVTCLYSGVKRFT